LRVGLVQGIEERGLLGRIELLEELDRPLARQQLEDGRLLFRSEMPPAVGEVDGADLAQAGFRRVELALLEDLFEVGEIDLEGLQSLTSST
jgi:hypothetical protein